LKTFTRAIIQLSLLMVLIGVSCQGSGFSYAEEGSKTLILTDRAKHYPLEPYMEVLEDPTCKLSVQDVTKPPYSTRFSPLPEGSRNLGFTSSAVWIRCRVRNEASTTTRWVIVLGDARISYLDCFIDSATELGVFHKHSGRFMPFDSREVPHNKFVLTLPLSTDADETLLLRFETGTAMNVGASISAFEAFAYREFTTRLILGMFVGALVVMMLYHGFLYFSMGDKSFIYFVLFIACFLFNQAAREGLAQEYVWSGWLNSYGLQLCGFLAIIAGLQFAVAFLGTRDRTPLLHRVISALTAVSTVGALMSPFAGFLSLVLALLIAAAIPTVFTAIVLTWSRGFKPARYVILAAIPLFAAFINHTATDLGLLQSTPVTEYWKWLGMILSILLLSLALSDRVKLMREEKEAAQQELAQSEQRLRSAWETNPEYLCISRFSDAMIVDVNKGFSQLTGYSRDEVVGKSAIDIGLVVDQGERQALADTLLKQGSVREQEIRLRKKNGEITSTLMSASLMNLHGELHILAVAKSIDRLKQAEKAIRESEAKYRAMVESMRSGIAVYEAVDGGHDFVFRDFNASAERISKATRDEVVGKTLLSIFPNMDRVGLLDALKRVYLTGKPEHLPALYYEDSKRKGWRENFVYKVPTGEVVVIYDDVTARIEAEHLAHKRADELEAINRLGREVSSSLALEEIVRLGLRVVVPIVNSDCAMLFVRENGNLRLHGMVQSSAHASEDPFPVHKVGECLCGISAREGVPVFCTNIHDDPRCTWTECRNAGLHSLAAIPLIAADEVIGVLALGSFQERDFSKEAGFVQSLAHGLSMGVKNALLFRELHKHALELEKNLEELKQAHEARDLLQSQLLQAQKMEAIGRLAGGIAHDFNNLLTVMAGYSAMLKTQFPENTPQREKMLQINRAAERASGLTRQLLAFSRRQVLEMRVIDLNNIVFDLEQMLKRLLREDIELLTVCRASPSSVTADQDQIGQIIVNLAVNARDAMPDGGKLTLETGNAVLDATYAQARDEVEPGPYVMLAISDNGIGMDAETQARIFEPFFTTKAKGRGTGLGLATVFGIVKQHRGHVAVYSELGRGTTFRVYFPLADAPITSTGDTSAPVVGPQGDETILVVEDEEFVRNFACEVLESLGYITLAAKDPDEALCISASHEATIHLLLTDVVLPIMDGRSLFARLHEERPEMCVLYMSGYTDDAIVHHGVLDSSVHFLQKPFSTTDLAKKVSEAMGRSALFVAEASPLVVTAAPEIDDASISQRLVALPADLWTELSRAALETNRQKTAEVVSRIRVQDQELAAILESWLSRFRFDKIVSLLERQERSE
jgi:PAS domain S-box-containing protein